MAATAATFMIKLSNGATRALDVYVPDAAGGYFTFDDGLGAASTSSTFFTLDQDGVLYDVAFAGAPTATRFRFTSNGIPSNIVLRIASHATTVATRPPLAIPIKAGNRVGAINLA